MDEKIEKNGYRKGVWVFDFEKKKKLLYKRWCGIGVGNAKNGLDRMIVLGKKKSLFEWVDPYNKN